MMFCHRRRVVQNIGRLLVVGVVDVESSKNEEEDADQHLRKEKSLVHLHHHIRGDHIRKILMK